MSFRHRLLLGIIGSFQVFNAAFIMTGGGPRNSTRFYMLHLYEKAFQQSQMGYAAAPADTAIHSIDLYRFLTGERPITGVRSLTATQETTLGPALLVEVTGIIVLQAEPGVIGVVESS